MGHASRSMGDNDVVEKLNYGDLAPEISEKNFSTLPSDCSCGILVKKIVYFFCYS